jgi:hypothetical protein
MDTIKDYVDILMVLLSLVPFATNGTYGHDYEWKQVYSVGWKSY